MSVAGLDPLQSAVLVVMIIGIAGALIPGLPGPLLVWLAALVYNLLRGFTLTSSIVAAVMTLLTIAGSTTELWLSGAGARRGGASGCAVFLALIAGLVGLVFFSVVGAILLPVLTVLVVELLRVRDPRRALRAGGGYFVGWLISTGVELTAVLLMIGLWVWSVRT
jgi:uncharacterized protein YqgC (DUF456 family)